MTPFDHIYKQKTAFLVHLITNVFGHIYKYDQSREFKVKGIREIFHNCVIFTSIHGPILKDLLRNIFTPPTTLFHAVN